MQVSFNFYPCCVILLIMKILGIESSCDETAAAVIEFTTPDQSVKLLSTDGRQLETT